MNPHDIMQLKRRSQFDTMFNPTGPTFPGSYNPEGQNPDDFVPPPIASYDVASRMRDLYQPQTANIDRFNSTIDAYPQQPTGQSGLRKLGAILLGGTADAFGSGKGEQAYRGLMFGDYDRQLQDWKNKIEPIERAANIERQSNVNDRANANSIIANEMRDRTITETQRKNEENEKLGRSKLEEQTRRNQADEKIRQQRTDIYKLKAEQKHLRFDFSGPYVVVTDPGTGQIFRTDVETGNLSDTDKLTLDYENASKLIGLRGTEARKNIEAKGEVDTKLEDKRQQGKIDLKKTPTGNLSERGMTPSQVKVHQYNMARLLKNSRADLAQYIILDPTRNDFSVDLKKVPPDKLKELNDLIYGKMEPIDFNKKDNISEPKVMEKQVRNKETGEEKTAYSYDNGKTWTFEKKVK